jgi:Zn-dependent peptidase ImmA (M78 family)/transcriptional regulator with XRE-family HTH domain
MRQEAFVNPDLLIWARESINMDIDEAAKKINVKADRLREWENGHNRPTIIQARKMSQVYRRPLSSFYLPERPTSLGFSVPHDFRRLPKDQPRDLSPELISELRRIEYLRDSAIEIAEELPEKPNKFVGSIRLGDSVESVVRRVWEYIDIPMVTRRHWRTPYDALNGWKDIIEQQGVLVMHLDRVEIEEIRGVVIAEPVFPLIAVNGKDSPTGRIFTLVHEFTHLMLGASGMSNMRLTRRPITQEQRVEQFCNRIAGEILVPTQVLLSHKDVQGVSGTADWSDETIRYLANYFKVSREVVVRRLVILGRATDAFYRQKRRQYAEERAATGKKTSVRIPMSRRIIRAIGQPFARIVLDAYHREAISSSDLAEMLGARLKHLRAVEDILGGRNVLTGGDQ